MVDLETALFDEYGRPIKVANPGTGALFDSCGRPVISLVGSVPPSADDTYWLGTDTLGWKGIKFPDLKLFQASANLLEIQSIAGMAKGLKTTGSELTSPTIQGTVLAGTGLTLPAFSLGGKLTGGANEIEGNNFDIDGGTIDGVTLTAPTIAGSWGISGNPSIQLHTLYTRVISGRQILELEICPNNADNADIEIKARDNGAGLVEIARSKGAADPWFGIGLNSATIKATYANLLGFFGATPVARASAYTPTNVIPDRSYDADAVDVAELADVLGTLIADLQSYGLLQ